VHRSRKAKFSIIDRGRECNRPVATSKSSGRKRRKEFPAITRIWHGATPAAKSDECLNLMRTVAIPDYRSTRGKTGAYALRRIQ
jgi:hypothetical protein